MRFWVSLEFGPMDEMVQFARDVEEMGYEGLVVPEHLVVKVGDRTPHPNKFQLEPDLSFPDPFCVFSAMAAVTSRLRFLTMVYVVPLRNVFAVTKQAATLAVLSNNRFVLGTGTGWLPEEFDTVGEDWSTRGRRFDEMLDIMRDFWDDGYAEYHGKFFDFPESGMFPVPTQPVPVWIGGHSSRAAQRAARFDGYLPMDGLHDRTRQEFAAIDAYRAEHGLDGPYERMITGNVEPTVDNLRRMAEEDGITGVSVYPWRPWRQPSRAKDYAEKIDMTKRFADEVMARV
jgi:probable F420-dependent oxidoreductase